MVPRKFNDIPRIFKSWNDNFRYCDKAAFNPRSLNYKVMYIAYANLPTLRFSFNTYLIPTCLNLCDKREKTSINLDALIVLEETRSFKSYSSSKNRTRKKSQLAVRRSGTYFNETPQHCVLVFLRHNQTYSVCGVHVWQTVHVQFFRDAQCAKVLRFRFNDRNSSRSAH